MCLYHSKTLLVKQGTFHVKGEGPNLYPQGYNITKRLNNIILGNGLVGNIRISELKPQQTVVVAHWSMDSYAFLGKGIWQLLKIGQGPGDRLSLSPWMVNKGAHARAGRPACSTSSG